MTKIRAIGLNGPEDVPGNAADEMAALFDAEAEIFKVYIECMPDDPRIQALAEALESGGTYSKIVAVSNLGSLPDEVLAPLKEVHSEMNEACYRQIRRQGGVK
jgi:hypothetical protein